MVTACSKNYSFKCQNIRISIFNVETEDMAWYRLRQSLQNDEDNFKREMPQAEEFEIKQI